MKYQIGPATIAIRPARPRATMTLFMGSSGAVGKSVHGARAARAGRQRYRRPGPGPPRIRARPHGVGPAGRPAPSVQPLPPVAHEVAEHIGADVLRVGLVDAPVIERG